MSWFDDEATDRAVALYHRRGERLGLTLMQPSRSASERVDNEVILRGGGTVLERYRVRPDDRLRRLGS